jgi:dipeptidyl aminopeptidase/acylaminoacyl peptidase
MTIPRPVDLVVGRDEAHGLPCPTRPEAPRAATWRLETVAEMERPRDLQVTPDGGIVFVLDRDSSDVWHLPSDSGPPVRLTTQREPAPYWEDTPPAVAPDGTRVAFAADGAVWIAPVAGGPSHRITTAGSPTWIDDDELLVSIERDDATVLARVALTDGWPRLLPHGEGFGDCSDAAVSPDRTRLAFTFGPRADLNRSEIRVLDLATGTVRALTGTPRQHDLRAAWSPDGTTLAYASERSGWYELHLVDVEGGTDRQLTHDRADFAKCAWSADGARLLTTRSRHATTDLVTVTVADGAVTVLAPGGLWATPVWRPDGTVVATFESHAVPPRIERVDDRGTRTVIFDPSPAALRTAVHVGPEAVRYRSFDGFEIPGLRFRPTAAAPDRPVPAIVHPHGGPTSLYEDEWDGVAQYFLDKGYAWFAINYRGSTSYGQEFERANHGVWGVDDTRDCLAAYDHLAALDWIDPRRIAIVGASYGSYLALLAATDDPEHRFAAAVCTFGDCDIVTSWATGDREGVQDLERMMGTPAEHPDAYRAGSPVHRLDRIRCPLLVAHGERDERVHPSQSEELVGELRRLGKTYQYVTYPSEGHGFLRRAPFLDFSRRLERFLDWYLM